jgi:hypothetical protein
METQLRRAVKDWSSFHMMNDILPGEEEFALFRGGMHQRASCVPNSFDGSLGALARKRLQS